MEKGFGERPVLVVRFLESCGKGSKLERVTNEVQGVLAGGEPLLFSSFFASFVVLGARWVLTVCLLNE